jgi:hypothetical protein
VNTISCKREGRAAIHESGAWMARLLLAMATLTLVWLLAFAAQARADSLADGLASASDEMSDVLDPQPSTPAAEGAAPTDVTDPPVTDPPVAEPPVTDPPVTDPPVTDPPVAEPPVTDPPVTDPPVTDPPVAEPPVTDPPTDPTTSVPNPPSPTDHQPDEGAGTSIPSTDVSLGGADSAVSDLAATGTTPLPLLGSLGMAPPADPVNGTTGSVSSGGQSDAQKSAPSSPAPRSPWAPRPDAPLGGFAGGGVFGGSAGGGTGGAPMMLAGLIGLLGLWQLFGSRLSTRTTPLHGAAPAFQLKRPG